MSSQGLENRSKSMGSWRTFEVVASKIATEEGVVRGKLPTCSCNESRIWISTGL
jgi:hypothetical protein